MNNFKAKLYLIPNLIGGNSSTDVLPPLITEIVSDLKHFIVEDIRNARRFLKKLNPEIIIDDLTFYELNKHTDITDIKSYLDICNKAINIGLISEAGLPCVADPGNIIVKMAHEKSIKVIPLSGPSSIFMALMASGMNGQNFAFNGYLPVEQPQRAKALKKLENRAISEGQSQIFMDTPFRNNKLFEDILLNLGSDTYLCIAVNISCHDEFIITKKIADWKKNIIDLNKQPCIFII